MLYILWALLNIGIFIYFIIIYFNATKFIKENSGFLLQYFFVFGLLSFIGRSNTDNNNKEPNSKKVKIWKFSSADTLDKDSNAFIEIKLEKTLVSSIG